MLSLRLVQACSQIPVYNRRAIWHHDMEKFELSLRRRTPSPISGISQMCESGIVRVDLDHASIELACNASEMFPSLSVSVVGECETMLMRCIDRRW